MASFFNQLQTNIADHLLADDAFASISVLAEDNANIENTISRLTNDAGIAVVVATPNASVLHPDVEDPYYDQIDVQVDVHERPEINRRTGGYKTGLELAERICALLHHWTPDNLDAPLYAVPPTIVVDPPRGGLAAYACHFRTAGGLAVTLSTVATPVLTNTLGTVTITCATGGAATFYTTNGTYPSPRNGTLYTAGFIPGTGKTIKARAWLAGYLASNQATLAT